MKIRAEKEMTSEPLLNNSKNDAPISILSHPPPHKLHNFSITPTPIFNFRKLEEILLDAPEWQNKMVDANGITTPNVKSKSLETTK